MAFATTLHADGWIACRLWTGAKGCDRRGEREAGRGEDDWLLCLCVMKPEELWGSIYSENGEIKSAETAMTPDENRKDGNRERRREATG